MNTYIYAGNSSLLAIKDNDLNSVSSIRNHYLNIDWAWVIEEDGILKFKDYEKNRHNECCEACAPSDC